jgi:hypothetical protein
MGPHRSVLRQKLSMWDLNDLSPAIQKLFNCTLVKFGKKFIIRGGGKLKKLLHSNLIEFGTPKTLPRLKSASFGVYESRKATEPFSLG